MGTAGARKRPARRLPAFHSAAACYHSRAPGAVQALPLRSRRGASASAPAPGAVQAPAMRPSSNRRRCARAHAARRLSGAGRPATGTTNAHARIDDDEGSAEGETEDDRSATMRGSAAGPARAVLECARNRRARRNPRTRLCRKERPESRAAPADALLEELGRALGMTPAEVAALGLSPAEMQSLLAGFTEETVVVGSRAEARSATESAVPVDVLTATDLGRQGAGDLKDQLRTVIPSFNVNTQPIGGASTVVRPAMLRNLAPDHTLILVNGKRRHRGVDHRLARRQRRGVRFAGARHLHHPRDCATPGRGAARRSGGPVRLGRDRRRHELPAQGTPRRAGPSSSTPGCSAAATGNRTAWRATSACRSAPAGSPT